MLFKDHDLPALDCPQVRYELRPVKSPRGGVAEGLYAAWIILDNPAQYNSYTTDMVKDVILSFRKASNARDVVAVVFTGAGDRAFCTGGNTKEYAEYYAGRPDGVRAVHAAVQRHGVRHPRVRQARDLPRQRHAHRRGPGDRHGVRLLASRRTSRTSARPGPKHGSAPDGGATDFLPLYVGIEHCHVVVHRVRAVVRATRRSASGSSPTSSPALPGARRRVGRRTRSCTPTARPTRTAARIAYGEPKAGAELAAGKALLKACTPDLSLLDQAVDELVTKLALTFPGCTTRTLESLRKHKLAHWDQNREGSRSWLGLNMMTEANAGFRAFNEGPKDAREVDFVALRRRLAAGERWGEPLIQAVAPAPLKALE
jgi:6-oxo-cyclohex-1-ene-carbonyl-CoA hydrolase